LRGGNAAAKTACAVRDNSIVFRESVKHVATFASLWPNFENPATG